MLFQLQVTNDLRTKRSRGMRECRTAEAGMKFIGHRSAADLRVALENQRLESCLGQIESGDQAIVAATYDDDVAWVSVAVHRINLPKPERERLDVSVPPPQNTGSFDCGFVSLVAKQNPTPRWQ